MDTPGRQEVQQAQILDESFVLVDEVSAPTVSDCLADEEKPDVVLFLCKANDILHGGVKDDIRCLKDALSITKRKYGSYPLVMGIVSHVDALDPTDELLPSEYGNQKKSNIEMARRKLQARLVDAFSDSDADLMPCLLDTVPLSSVMVWSTALGCSAATKKKFTDYRYNIDTLLAAITDEKLKAKCAKVK